jgi:hypothetical protein
MHSIVLSKRADGSLYRLYVAEPRSDLHFTARENRREYVPSPTFRLGVHAHHCDLHLRLIKGEALHWIYEGHDELTQATQFTCGTQRLDGYRYYSKLRNQRPGFTYEETTQLQCVDFRILKAAAPNRACIHLPADAMHTMAIDFTQDYVAWVVEEGAEDGEYEPLTYSRHRLEEFDFSGLYQPASFEQFIELLEKASLI